MKGGKIREKERKKEKGFQCKSRKKVKERKNRKGKINFVQDEKLN